MYPANVPYLGELLPTVRAGAVHEPYALSHDGGRTLLRFGRVIDPKNGIDGILDLAIRGDVVEEISPEIRPERGDVVVDCSGLLVVPGLIDMHLHLGDLFEVSTDPIRCAVEDGVTMGLSPGAGNTFMAPALLGAEVDRGVPMNLGVYLGAGNVLSTQLTVDELTAMFRGELPAEVAGRKMTRNPITNTLAPFVIGIKDHMGHFIMSDENIDRIFSITSQAGLVYMSHTQDPEHARRLVGLSKGRPLHLAHATAAGCGTHSPGVEGLKAVLELVDGETITAEFVTSMLRRGGGSREGLQLPLEAQRLAYDALSDGQVRILISDGQNDATMKGFGDTRDNIPAILELAEMGVLSLSDAVATMTANPAALLAKRTENPFFTEKVGHLGPQALANVTVIDPEDKLATYTLVNGRVVAFENRAVRRNQGAGGWISRYGMLTRTGVGELSMFFRE